MKMKKETERKKQIAPKEPVYSIPRDPTLPIKPPVFQKPTPTQGPPPGWKPATEEEIRANTHGGENMTPEQIKKAQTWAPIKGGPYVPKPDLSRYQTPSRSTTPKPPGLRPPGRKQPGIPPPHRPRPGIQKPGEFERYRESKRSATAATPWGRLGISYEEWLRRQRQKK